jgi:hypothetical protein
MKLRIAILALALGAPALADDPPDGRAELDKGRQAYARQQFTEALTRFDTAEQAARTVGDAGLLLECLRMRAAVQRDSGDAAHAGESLAAAADAATKAYGESSPELAGVLEEIATGQRAQGHTDLALAAIEKASKIRDAQTGAARAGLARDLTLAAVLHRQAEQVEPATELLKRAIQEWSLAQPGDPQCLPAIEALAGIYRDGSKYADAEPLLQRAVRMREAASGLDDAELIPSVDSLAYVEFGLQKFPEAEALYQRLRGLWEKNAGADHPMVALTLDKMAEFYAFQHRYEEAEKAATAALALRTKAYIASLNQTGRVLLMEAKMDDAADLYHRTAQIGELAQAPDDVMDPSLHIYARILREMQRDDEAAVVEKRVKGCAAAKGGSRGPAAGSSTGAGAATVARRGCPDRPGGLSHRRYHRKHPYVEKTASHPFVLRGRVRADRRHRHPVQEIRAGQRPHRHRSRRPQSPYCGRQHLVPRRIEKREARQDRLRAPVRAPHVRRQRELPRPLYRSHGACGRHRPERHHQ